MFNVSPNLPSIQRAALALSLIVLALGTRAAQAAAPGFTPAEYMNIPREAHTATLLNNGKVLVAGGFSSINNRRSTSAELYDPASNTWSMTGSMSVAR